MRKLLGFIALLVIVTLVMLASSFGPETLPIAGEMRLELPEAHPPAEMRIAMIEAGKMKSRAAFAFRGGSLLQERTFNMGSFVVAHPQGMLLFDAGFGRNVDEHFKTIPWLMRATSSYEKEMPVAEQLAAAGIEPKSLKGIVLTHAHWDHVSGLDDLRGVPVWIDAAELAFVKSGNPATKLARDLNIADWHVYDFPNGPYLGFDSSYDIFGDGSVVLVPAPGHTPGSIIAFVHTPDGRHYALIGDLAWQTEGVSIPAQRPWLSRRLVDYDEESVRDHLVHMHRIQVAIHGMMMVPAHDRRVAGRLPPLSSLRGPAAVAAPPEPEPPPPTTTTP